MQTITETALAKGPWGFFSRMEAGTWLDVKGPALDGLLKHGAPRCVTAWPARREKEKALATDRRG